MKRLTLTWDNMPHTFTIWRKGGVLVGTFTVRKAKGTQRIPLRFPRSVSMRQIQDAWEKQKRRWRIVTSPVTGSNLFFAVRAINLPKHQILWFVLHANYRSYDACVVHRFGLPTWENECL